MGQQKLRDWEKAAGISSCGGCRLDLGQWKTQLDRGEGMHVEGEALGRVRT